MNGSRGGRALAAVVVAMLAGAPAASGQSGMLTGTASLERTPGSPGAELTDTRLVIDWVETGLGPQETTALSVSVTADSDYGCRHADGAIVEEPSWAGRGQTLGFGATATAGVSGQATGRAVAGEGDVAGGIHEVVRQGGARCAAGEQLVRTRITYYDITVTDPARPVTPLTLTPITYRLTARPGPPSDGSPPGNPENGSPSGTPEAGSPPGTPGAGSPSGTPGAGSPPGTPEAGSPAGSPGPGTPPAPPADVPAPAVPPVTATTGPPPAIRVEVRGATCRKARCRVAFTLTNAAGRDVRVQRRTRRGYRAVGPVLRVPTSGRVAVRLPRGSYRLKLVGGSALKSFTVGRR